MEKLEKLKKSLDNKFIPDNMKDKIRAEIKKLESEIKTDETMTATEVKEEVKEIEEKVEKALEVAEEKEEIAEAKAEEKKEKATRKAREKKATTSKTKKQKSEPKATAKKKSVFSLAKEIRKDGESWEEAKDRARKMMKSETTETKKKTKTETQKLLAMVRRNKEYKKLAGTSDLPKDAQRRALPRGKRVSESGNVYYENRANRVDVGGFKKAYLAKGGEIEMENSNLYFVGRGRDVNGNKVIKISFPNQKPFSIQTLGNLPKTHRILREYDNDKDITPEEIATMEREVISYVEEFGSKKQKESLRKYEGGGYANKGVYVETLDEEIDLTDDGKPRVLKTQEGGNKSFSQRREMHGASPEALAFADGGTIIGTPETPLARGLDIDYTGLVGETGGMSAGEMFAEGGSIENQYEGKTPKEVWNMWTLDQREHFLADHYDVLMGKDLGSKNKKFEDLADITQLQLELHISQGQYAMGGSLGNHGLKQGDQIIKTMSGGVQKVKTKSGDIVYVNLANGYRGAEPPLPFAKGGYTNERRHVNKAQDYEVRYAKNKPNRTGYLGKRSFDDGGISNGRYEVVKVIGFDKNGKTLPKNEIKVIADFDNRKEALNFVYEQQFKKDVTQRDIFIRDTKTNKTFAEGGFMTDPNFGDFQSGVYATGGVTKNYINRNQLNTITIKKGNQKLTYKVSDVYNGAYKLEDGGNLERTAFYVSKRNVVKVQLKDGKDVKVANGYWIKKGAKPIHTSKYDDGGEVEYGTGGKTTFKEKATAIAKNFEGKKVEPKYQKEYGKTYDKAEAKEVGNKIAGSQKAKYDSKMSGGGSTTRKPKTSSNNTMVLAKQIRKDGESWQSALKRAKEQIAKK